MTEKQKDDAGYTELYRTEIDDKGNLITTDERLYMIMLKKKKLMGEFLDAIKEASIDCIVNYEDKNKCLSFPIVKDANKKQITDINYKFDKYSTYSDKKQDKSANQQEEEDEDEPELITKREIHMIKLYENPDDTEKRRFAVDTNVQPNVVYDYNAFVKSSQLIKLGVLEINEQGKKIVQKSV